MIKVPTLLILGAGASAPYGYPTGKQLRKNILEKYKLPSNRRKLMQFSIEDDRINKFYNAFLKAPIGSIDAFLEHNADFATLGKLLISMEIINCEKEEFIYEKEDWYQLLFKKMMSSFDKFQDNELLVISFNYDRSFEHFLITAMQNTFGKSENECADKIQSFPIIHMYGQIGYLPWQKKNPLRTYRMTDSLEQIKECSRLIQTIHEASVNDLNENDLLAKNLVKRAERIYFLGFGYHQSNIEKVGILELPDPIQKEVLGTRFNLTEKEADDITLQTLKKIRLNLPNSRYQDILSFLRENVSFV